MGELEIEFHSRFYLIILLLYIIIIIIIIIIGLMKVTIPIGNEKIILRSVCPSQKTSLVASCPFLRLIIKSRNHKEI